MTIAINATDRSSADTNGEARTIFVHHNGPGKLLIRPEGGRLALEITEEEGRRLAAYLAPKAVDAETGEPVQVGVVLEPQPPVA